MDAKNAHDILPKLALSLIPGIGAAIARNLVARAGDIGGIFKLKRRELLGIPGVGTLIADRILMADTFSRAEQEIRYMEKEKISCMCLFDPGYPQRLFHCPDAPLILFIKGDLPDDGFHLLSIVGTRNPTPRGKRITRDLIASLAGKTHPVVIVSGLAYGIDVQAHLAALESGLKTIAVLGHGFHTLYPAVHRTIAEKIKGQGGLVTDFFSYNLLDPKNFIRRNRIIAGLSEATVVIESGVKGGAIITAEMANSYNRDVFAVPGRPDDPMSRGCNHLIRSNQASLSESAEDIEYLLGWETPGTKKQQVEPRLFEDLEPEEKQIIDVLIRGMSTVDQISREVMIPVQKISGLLLGLEFKGLIRALPGKSYSLAEN
jgi:DNA processing protein